MTTSVVIFFFAESTEFSQSVAVWQNSLRQSSLIAEAYAAQ